MFSTNARIELVMTRLESETKTYRRAQLHSERLVLKVKNALPTNDIKNATHVPSRFEI